MELRRYALIVRRWAWLILLFTIAGIAIAYAINIQLPRIYESSVTLLINQSPASASAPDYNAILTSERLGKTYAELIRKRPVLDAVVAKLSLTGESAALERRVRVTLVRDTQLLVVTVSDTDPQRAADTANALVNEFIERNQALQAGRYAESKRSLEAELGKIQSEIDTTQAALDALDAAGGASQTVERNRLQALLAEYRSSYANLLRSLEEVRLVEAQATTGIEIVEAGKPAITAVSPRIMRNLFVGLTLGLLLGFGLVLLIEYLDDTVKTHDDLTEIFNSGPLAVIDRIEGKALSDKLVTASDPRSSVAEAYRLLRVNIELSSIDHLPQTLLVTSSVPAEGKSTTAANLAVALAQAGRQVILVDADLRRPALHNFFQIQNTRGLTTALLGREGVGVEHYLLNTRVARLRLLPCGVQPPNPADLLGSQRMARLVEELKQHADIVLFDSPPLLAVADASVLARACDATLLVVRAAATRVGLLQRANEQLVQAGAGLIGVVLNRVQRSAAGYDNRYHYYYRDDDHNHRNGNGNGGSSSGRHSVHPGRRFRIWPWRRRPASGNSVETIAHLPAPASPKGVPARPEP